MSRTDYEAASPAVPVRSLSMDGIQIRVATPNDFDEILDVCSVSLGWVNPAFDRDLFRWKHETNAFGRSLIMVAESRDGLVAVRPFMRWRFRNQRNTLSAARAVDTATRPEARGQGLFRTLTESGIEVLRDEGVDIIFNTPNDQSRPGYLKMGWRDTGRVAVGLRLGRLRSLPRLRNARVAAEKLSLPATFGHAVEDDLEGIDLNSAESTDGVWRTDHSVSSLMWRYGAGPVNYRWIPGPEGSGIFARARRRGMAIELLIAEVVGNADRASQLTSMKLAIAKSGADIGVAPPLFPGTIAITRLGPRLAMRRVTSEPEPDDHQWQPGDLELF